MAPEAVTSTSSRRQNPHRVGRTPTYTSVSTRTDVSVCYATYRLVSEFSSHRQLSYAQEMSSESAQSVLRERVYHHSVSQPSKTDTRTDSTGRYSDGWPGLLCSQGATDRCGCPRPLSGLELAEQPQEPRDNHHQLLVNHCTPGHPPQMVRPTNHRVCVAVCHLLNIKADANTV